MRFKERLKRAISRVTPASSGGGARVLLYHAVDAPEPADVLALRVSRDRFVEQMTCLRDEGYSVVPLAGILGAAPGNGMRVAITFDDGYRSLGWAADTLRRFGFPATFFLVPRFLDGVGAPSFYWEGWGHLGWHEAGQLLQAGFEVGAHSATHRDLTACADEELRAEVAGSKKLLEERLCCEVSSFSYPHGRQNRRVRRAVAEARFAIGCTSRYGLNDNMRPPHAVCRTEITGRDTLQDFRWKLQGKYDWLGYWQDVSWS